MVSSTSTRAPVSAVRTSVLLLAVAGLLLAGCVHRMVQVEDGSRSFRHNEGVYEISLPDQLPPGWEWEVGRAGGPADFRLFERRLGGWPRGFERGTLDPVAEVTVVYGVRLRHEPRGLDLVERAKWRIRTLYGDAGDLRRQKVKRVGDILIDDDTGPLDLTGLERSVSERVVGPHVVVEGPTVVYEERRDVSVWNRPIGLTAERWALVAANEEVIADTLRCDLERLEGARPIFYEVIRRVRLP